MANTDDIKKAVEYKVIAYRWALAGAVLLVMYFAQGWDGWAYMSILPTLMVWRYTEKCRTAAISELEKDQS